ASHVIEHLPAHEAQMALAECFRVLKPGGTLEAWVPDLQAVGGRLAADQLDVPLYNSGLGPVAALDMIYGHRGSIAGGSPAMAHRTGFTASSLRRALERAGFLPAVERITERGSPELKALAVKPEQAGGGSR